MIYVFYNNDPLAQDLGGGAEHFRGLHRALLKSGLEFRLIASRLQNQRTAPHVAYISKTSNFVLFYIALWRWFWRNRQKFNSQDVFHFHRNYAAWPKYLFAPKVGRVMISYHNVTGKVLQGKLGILSVPLRHIMLFFERKAARWSDAIICVSDRDRKTLEAVVEPSAFKAASVIPAAFDANLFDLQTPAIPDPALATKVVILGRISHQKNVPLAIETIENLLERGRVFDLTIAGDGEDSRILMKRLAESPAKDHIRWVGRVPHDRVPEILTEHGILLLTSRYEASPTVVKEALRSMRPVVSTDVGDIPDWISEGRSGFVCESDAGALADGLLKAERLICDQEYICTDRIEDLSEEAIMSEVMQLYRRLQAV